MCDVVQKVTEPSTAMALNEELTIIHQRTNVAWATPTICFIAECGGCPKVSAKLPLQVVSTGSHSHTLQMQVQ